MLVDYYHSMGLYAISPSESESDEGEPVALDELSHYSEVSGNSDPSDVRKSATSPIDVKHFLAASTSDYEGSELVSTDVELWSSPMSTSSLCT